MAAACKHACVVILLLESGPQCKLCTNTYFTGEEADELPLISTISECHAAMQTLNDLLAAYKLASQEN